MDGPGLNLVARHLGRVILNITFIVAGPLGLRAETVGDPDKGAVVFEKCAPCHEIGPDAAHQIGPQLNAIVGRRAASAEGYDRYSDAMIRQRNAGLIWDLPRLEAYITLPQQIVPGTWMNFDGISKPEDRRDLLAYLGDMSRAGGAPTAAAAPAPTEYVLAPEVLNLVGDADYGGYLAGECTTCHQRDGQDAGIPSITGWPTETFVRTMHAYKQKQRSHPAMTLIAGRLSDEEIAALAAYFKDEN